MPLIEEISTDSHPSLYKNESIVQQINNIEREYVPIYIVNELLLVEQYEIIIMFIYFFSEGML